MGLLTRKTPAFTLEYVGEETRSRIDPELAQDMDYLCDVIIYMECLFDEMKKIVQINRADEKLAKCREDFQNTEWWKEKQSLLNSAKTIEDVWPFLKKAI